MNEPILGKAHPHGYDYKPITWGAFLELRKAAQKVANSIAYPVYLVGSILSKPLPRDIDISIIIPHKEYTKMFGKLPKNQDDYGRYLGDVILTSFKHVKHLYFCIDYHLDIKVCPDSWWKNKPKMLLAEPRKKRIVKSK